MRARCARDSRDRRKNGKRTHRLEVVLRYIQILLLVLLVGCGASVTYGEFPYTASTCVPGDKEKAWDEFVRWGNALGKARRAREKYCSLADTSRYALYCIELEIYHARVERYVKHLEAVYTDTCTADEMQF